MIFNFRSEAIFYVRMIAMPIIYIFCVIVLTIFTIWLAQILGGLTDLGSIAIFMTCVYSVVALLSIILDRIAQRLWHG